MSSNRVNIQIIASAALHPQGRGAIERQIGLIKSMLNRALKMSFLVHYNLIV